jgi:hypothetical protein
LIKQSGFSKRAGASLSGMSLNQNNRGENTQGFGKWDESQGDHDSIRVQSGMRNTMNQ